MRKVKYARLQGTEAFLPEFGIFGTTLGDPNKKANYAVEMFEDGDKLLLKLTRAGKTVEAFVPLTNVQIAQYEDEAPAAAKASVKKAS